jgi:hypothetical protein
VSNIWITQTGTSMCGGETVSESDTHRQIAQFIGSDGGAYMWYTFRMKFLMIGVQVLV